MTLDQDAINQQFDLLVTYRRTLAHLLQQAAQFGGEVFAPPQTANGIAEARAEIQRIKAVLREGGVEVEDDPNDDAPPKGNETRLNRLDEFYRESIAHCIERWQAAGLTRTEAVELAEDHALGVPPEAVQPSVDSPIILYLGELGIGKSLTAHRLFQQAVDRARENADMPIPVFLQAQSTTNLREVVEKATGPMGDVRTLGAIIVIDGADEAGSGAAVALLSQARILVHVWPKTTVFITSRPLPALTHERETVQAPLLTVDESYQLVAQSAGIARGEIERRVWGWPQSVKDAVRRPLFAILMGQFLREDDGRMLRSTGELLTHLVTTSLGRVGLQLAGVESLLHRLAVLVSDRGNHPVPSAEVAPWGELQLLLNSGLVVERSGAVHFPLQILSEWFAAQSLAVGTPSIVELMKDVPRLDHWRYPLIIFISTFGHDTVSDLLMPLAEHHPAIAAEIVMEGLAGWESVEDSPLPPPLLDCGRRIRTAMQSWIRGIGSLSTLTAPIRSNGALLTLGVRTWEQRIITAWYKGPEDLGDIVELPLEVCRFDSYTPNWVGLEDMRTRRQSAWSWRTTLESLVFTLTDLLRRRKFPLEDGSLLDEALWPIGLAITKRRARDRQPISLDGFEAYLDTLSPNTVQVSLNGTDFDPRWLRSTIEHLRASGRAELLAPWPGPDRVSTGQWVWSDYSDEQLLARTTVIYTAALASYQRLVSAWFPQLAPRMTMAVTLPARLVGVVVPPRQDDPARHYPDFKWYLEALPRGSQTITDIRLGEHLLDDEAAFIAEWERQTARLRMLRSDAMAWLGFSLHSSISGMFDSAPITRLVYSWLTEDLRRIHWAR